MKEWTGSAFNLLPRRRDLHRSGCERFTDHLEVVRSNAHAVGGKDGVLPQSGKSCPSATTGGKAAGVSSVWRRLCHQSPRTRQRRDRHQFRRQDPRKRNDHLETGTFTCIQKKKLICSERFHPLDPYSQWTPITSSGRARWLNRESARVGRPSKHCLWKRMRL